MLLALIGTTLAAPVLLHADDVRPAQRRVAKDLRAVDVVARTPRELARRLDSEPHFVRAPEVSRCTGRPTVNADLLRLLREAEEFRAALRIEGWWERLRAGSEAWTCLGEPADAALGARLHFLLGVGHAVRGEPEPALAAFRAALRSDPDLAWDDDFPPDGFELFEQVRQEPRPDPVRVRLVPPDATPALRVDGRSVTVRDGVFQLEPGLRLVQLEEGSPHWIAIQEDDWLVLPNQIRDPLVLPIQELSTREAIAGLLEDAHTEGQVLVPDRHTTWSWGPTQGWKEHRAPLTRRVSKPLTITGLAVFAAGIGWMVRESVVANRRIDEVQVGGLNTPRYATLGEQHEASQTRFTIGATVAGVGGLAAGIGGVLVVTSW